MRATKGVRRGIRGVVGVMGVMGVIDEDMALVHIGKIKPQKTHEEGIWSGLMGS